MSDDAFASRKYFGPFMASAAWLFLFAILATASRPHFHAAWRRLVRWTLFIAENVPFRERCERAADSSMMRFRIPREEQVFFRREEEPILRLENFPRYRAILREMLAATII